LIISSLVFLSNKTFSALKVSWVILPSIKFCLSTSNCLLLFSVIAFDSVSISLRMLSVVCFLILSRSFSAFSASVFSLASFLALSSFAFCCASNARLFASVTL
jgi:hypothetical protein